MQRIRVESEPFGSSVQTKQCGPASTKTATTPAVVWVSRRAKRCTLTITAPGFEPRSVSLRRVVSDRTLRNAEAVGELCDSLECNSFSDVLTSVFFGGLVAGTGFGVDAVTGAMFQQDPSSVYVKLVPTEEK
jgi:hypothetical protein